ncbi:protein wntless homolog [Aplysia californica]|uniref:Protein wntless homolog n=1 Tax=Aplysia californica TaxID=6500 RepID=A0ABM0JPK5_APLCA|nr:protein wntless homolog [Aplysia californica]
MAGVVLETLSNRKLLILSVSLVLILAVFFLIGGLVAPAPNSVIPSTTVKCVDADNIWQKGEMKPFLPRGKGKCDSIDHFSDPRVAREGIDANEIVFSQWMPLPKDGKQLDMSRWFQNMVSVIELDLTYNSQNKYPEDRDAHMVLETRVFYRNKEDDVKDWKLLAASTEHRTLQCSIENDNRQDGKRYQCDLLPFFELGTVFYDFYLINIRLPIDKRTDINIIGQLDDLAVVVIFQNGGFTKVWFSIKTVLFPAVVAVLLWFWQRVLTEGRATNLTERTLFSLGIILSIMNCPIEWLTLVVSMPFMTLLNDIRDGAFYAMLFSFWLIFVGEHMMDQVERNQLKAYWKQLTVVILASAACFIFDMCERGVQLTNPFFSIWSSEVGAIAALGFIIVAGISACLYFVFLCYLVFRVFRNISSKRTSLMQMSSVRRKYYSGLIYRFKFLMLVTLLCAALTVISFIIGQVSEGQWKWGDEDLSLEYTSAFLTGTYGMWNVYVISLLCLYAPSHKKYAADTVDETDTNSREEEVQLTQMASESSNIASFISKQAAD